MPSALLALNTEAQLAAGVAPRRTAVAPERVAGAAGRRRAGRDHLGRVTAHAAAFVRDPSPGGRGRCPRGAGIAGTRLGDDHTDLHDGHRARAARSVGRGPSAGALAAEVVRLQHQVGDQGLVFQVCLVFDGVPLLALLLAHVLAVLRARPGTRTLSATAIEPACSQPRSRMLSRSTR